MHALAYPADFVSRRGNIALRDVRLAFHRLDKLKKLEKRGELRSVISRGLQAVYAMALDIAYNPPYMFDRGRMVFAPHIMQDGSMKKDESGEPIMYPVIDRALDIKSKQLLLQVIKQMSDFDGLGMPSKVAVTDPSGKQSSNQPVTFYQIELPNNGRDQV